MYNLLLVNTLIICLLNLFVLNPMTLFHVLALNVLLLKIYTVVVIFKSLKRYSIKDIELVCVVLEGRDGVNNKDCLVYSVPSCSSQPISLHRNLN